MPKPAFDDPIEWFDAWFSEASRRISPDPNAMALSTVDADGRPSSRIVLLKDFGDDGFVFHTNRESRKGRDLAVNPYAALLFYWRELDRQVRIEGRVEWVEDAESDVYFATRARGSQLGAWASKQSQPLPSRDALLAELAAADAKFHGAVPRPPHWGGYRLVADRIEFWQAGEFRLHDRYVFERPDGAWAPLRLYP